MNDPTVHTLIRQAMARGVHVRVLKDPNPLEDPCDVFQTGQIKGSNTATCQDQQQLVQDVRNAGGTFQPFDKSQLCPNGGKSSFPNDPAGSGCFEHGKIAIVDGQTALLSSGNFDDTNLCIDNPSRCDRDYTVIENDQSIVSTLENIFDSDLKGNSYDVRTLIPSQLDNVLTVSPYSLQPLLTFINGARSSISVETQYLKDPEINAALVGAAKRGVKVDVTVASICAFGTPTSSAAKQAQTTYGSFDSAGISTTMFNASNTINGKPGYLHAKAIIVDGNQAWVGSENGSTESLTENREYGVIFNDASWVQSLQTQVESDHNSPDSETWSQSLQCAKDGGSVGAGPGAEGTSTPPVTTKPPKPKKPTPVNPTPVEPAPTKPPKKPKKPKPGTDGSATVSNPSSTSSSPSTPSEPTQGKKKKKKPSDSAPDAQN